MEEYVLYRPETHSLMRRRNTLTILECIRNYGPITKKDIKVKTGLSWGAVSNIVADLLQKEIIYEVKSTNRGVGRAPCKYDINSSKNLIIGVDINIEGIKVVMIDLKCNVIGMISKEILINNREDILKQAKIMIYTLIEECNVSKDKIIGIGIAMQGTVDVERGVSVFTPYFNNWINVPLRDIFETEFGIPVLVEHDPNCMALAEKWFSFTDDIKNFLFIRLSMGIGLSIIIDGKIYRGVDGCAGEFGHLTMNPNGGRCTCGNFGCLEVYASGRGIIQRAMEGLKLGRTPILSKLVGEGNEVDIHTVGKAAREGDMYLRSLFDDGGTYLGVGISNLINLFNPELIIIGGELIKYSDLFFDRAKDVVNKKVWKNCRVNLQISKLDSSSAAIGAATLFVEKIFAREETDSGIIEL